MTDRAPTTDLKSEGYNNRLSLIIGKHPSLHTFISVLKVEFREAVNDATTASSGKDPVKSAPHAKSVRTIKQRKNLMENLRTGTTDLLTFQKSIGGSIVQTLGGVLGDDDFDEDEEMPELSENEDIEILVPTLGEIIIPAGFPEQINEVTVSQEPEMIDSIREVGPYRHVRVQEKRKSEVSHSVAGHDLRLKRRRVEGERSQAVRVLPTEIEDTEDLSTDCFPPSVSNIEVSSVVNITEDEDQSFPVNEDISRISVLIVDQSR